MKVKTIIISLFLLPALLLLLYSCHPPGPASNSLSAADSIAYSGLNTYKVLVKQGTAMGVIGDSFAIGPTYQPDSLHLGVGIKLYIVRLDTLKAYNPAHAQNLLFDVHRVVYPIFYKGNVVSSEELQFNSTLSQWQLRAFGDRAGMRAFKTYSPGIQFTGPSNLVRIPSLAIEFMEGQKNGISTAVYLGSTPRDSILPGQPMPLTDVIRFLHPFSLTVSKAGP